MAKFIETHEGFINLDLVKRVNRHAGKGGAWCVTFEFNDGKELSVDPVKNPKFNDEVLAHTSAQIVPAMPGFYVLSLGEDGSVTREPIIAWSIDAQLGPYGAARPLTVGGALVWDDPGWAVLEPGGRVVRSGDVAYDDEAAWKADAEKQIKAEVEAVQTREAAEGR